MSFGRNQIIAIVSGAVVLACSYALVWTGHVTGSEWLSFAQWFLPTWLGVTLGASAAVKVSSVFGSKADAPQPDCPQAPLVGAGGPAVAAQPIYPKQAPGGQP